MFEKFNAGGPRIDFPTRQSLQMNPQMAYFSVNLENICTVALIGYIAWFIVDI